MAEEFKYIGGLLVEQPRIPHPVPKNGNLEDVIYKTRLDEYNSHVTSMRTVKPHQSLAKLLNEGDVYVLGEHFVFGQIEKITDGIIKNKIHNTPYEPEFEEVAMVNQFSFRAMTEKINSMRELIYKAIMFGMSAQSSILGSDTPINEDKVVEAVKSFLKVHDIQ